MSEVTIQRPLIGVGVIVWKGDSVLLGERVSADEDCWQFPGGHLEAGESVTACALREVHEEAGLDVAEPRLATYTDEAFTVDGMHYVTLYVSVEWQAGEALVLEPEKCRRWQWFDYRSLPRPLFIPIRQLLKQCGDLKQACATVDTRAGVHR